MSNSQYNERFKRNAIEKYRLHRSIDWVCDLLGVPPSMLTKWVIEAEQSELGFNSSKG